MEECTSCHAVTAELREMQDCEMRFKKEDVMWLDVCVCGEHYAHVFDARCFLSPAPSLQTRAIGGSQKEGFTVCPMGRPHGGGLAGGRAGVFFLWI